MKSIDVKSLIIRILGTALVMVLMGLMTGCAKWEEYYHNELCNYNKKVEPPFPKPDDFSKHNSVSGYQARTFTYNCLNGKYQIFTYTREHKCEDYSLEDTFESEGICD